MNTKDAKIAVMKAVIDNNISNTGYLLGKVNLTPAQIHDVVDMLIEDGLLIETGETVSGKSFEVNKD